MQNVPKFVLQRLQQTPPAAESHPDADLLTAFAEQSLAGRERHLVIEHLAYCDDCREVVTLALPATEIVAIPASASSFDIGWFVRGWFNRSRFSWPILRWGALAAGILAVTSVGVLQYTHVNQEHRNQEKNVASNLVPRDAAGMSRTPSKLASPPSNEMQDPVAAHQAVPKVGARVVAAPPKSHAHSSGVIGGGLIAGGGSGSGAGIVSDAGQAVSPGAESVLAQASEIPTPAPAQPQKPTPEIHQQVVVGAVSQVVEVQSGARAAVSAESAALTPNQLALNQTELPSPGRDITNLDVVKAKDPVPAQAQSSSSPAPTVAPPSFPLQTSPSLMLRSPRRWTISPAGALQRSFDGGNTWENVNPSASAASAASRIVVSAEAAKEKAGQNAADLGGVGPDKKYQKASPNPILVFRTVAASGLEVWAGATDGILYHSSDGGNRWALTVPTDSVTILTGDITSIHFSGPRLGKIATSTGELWITFDAGLTWGRPQ